MPMRSVLSILVCISAGLAASTDSAGPAGTRPTTATAPASAPATATAPVVPQVQWHTEYKIAAEHARKRGILLVVVFFEGDSAACEAFEGLTLKSASTRRFLASFAAVKLNVADTEGRRRFADSGAERAPLTQVFSPAGELLDSIPGCIIPAARFCRRLERSLVYWKTAAARPFDAAAQWKAVRVRLELSTREGAVSLIDKLLKLPAGRLPEGVTAARLHLVRGKALLFAKSAGAEKDLKQAISLGAKDVNAGGEALLALARLAERNKNYKQAHEYCRRYIKAFPKGPHIGSAYYTKAVLEVQVLDDRAAARKTLGEFIAEYPDDKSVVEAKRLLDVIGSPVTTAPVTTAPVTTAPVTTAPVTTAPVTTAPVTSIPVTTTPVTTTPVTTTKGAQK